MVIRSYFKFFAHLIFCSVLTTGCSRGLDSDLVGGASPLMVSDFIQGSVDQNILSRIQKKSKFSLFPEAYADRCDPVASLYRLKSSGERESVPITQSKIDSKKQYLFKNVSALGVQLSANEVRYLIDIEGCETVYSRYVTGSREQVINHATSFIALASNSSSKSQVPSIKRSELFDLTKSLLNKAKNASSFQEVKEVLSENSELANQFFTLFQILPETLQESAPNLSLVSTPAKGQETQLVRFQVSAHHWIPTYEIAYVWKLNGEVVSNSHLLTFTPSKNQQGNHTIVLYVGKKTNNQLDIQSPYQMRVFDLEVEDTFPVSPPDFSILNLVSFHSKNYTHSTQLSLALQTGTSLSNCATFDSIAVTETPMTPTSNSLFQYQCSQSPSQNITYTLSDTTDGLKTLYLWSKDSSGNINKTAKTFSFQLKRNTPSIPNSFSLVNITPGTTSFITQPTLNVTGISEENTYRLYLNASCSGPEIGIISNIEGSGSFSGFSISGDGLKNFYTKSQDFLGQTSACVSTALTYTLDTTAPSVPALTLQSPVVTSRNESTVRVQSCIESETQVFIQSSLSNTAPAKPSIQDAGWIACQTSMDYTVSLSSAEGTQYLFAWLKDETGNISAASSSLSIIRDTTPPTSPAFTIAQGNRTSSIALSLTLQSCSDVHSIYLSESPTAPSSPSDSGWIPCNTTPEAISYTLNHTADGSKTLYLWSRDSGSIHANISTSPSSVTFQLDRTAPVLQKLVINPMNASDTLGDTYAGTQSVSIRIKANDAQSSSITFKLKEISPASATCESQVNGGTWETFTPNTNGEVDIARSIAAIDGTKKFCAWVRDDLLNTSVISDATPESSGVNFDTIIFEVGNIPVITSLSVKNNTAGANFGTTTFQSGNQMKIDFTLTDVEGLDPSPYTLQYTTDNSVWRDIVTQADVSDPSNITWLGSIGSGQTSHSGSLTTYNAPASSYFRLRMIARDRSGNRSLGVMSDMLNLGRWSVFAGSQDRGVGSGPLNVRMTAQGYSNGVFIVHPTTGDIYAADFGAANVSMSTNGIYKLDARTGTVSLAFRLGTANILGDGPLPSNPSLPNFGSNARFMAFDRNGLLYVQSTFSGRAALYQINLSTQQVRRYLGGGTDYSDSADPLQTVIISSSFEFDQDNNLYFFSACASGAFDGRTSPARLMRISQTTNDQGAKIATNLTRIAGNCTRGGSITNGTSALENPLQTDDFNSVYLQVVPVNSDLIYFNDRGSNFRKIHNGMLYTSSAPSYATMRYHPQKNLVYVGYLSGTIATFTPPTVPQANGETLTPVISGSGTGDCTAELRLASPSANANERACVVSMAHLDFSPSGQLLFPDGLRINSTNPYRIRYVDEQGRVRTIMGTRNFHDEGIERLRMYSDFGPIYYKKASEPNQTAFPEGLYFLDKQGMVFGRIEPENHPTKPNKVTLIWGNQISGTVPATSTPVSTAISLSSQGSISHQSLNFDSNGLPYFFNHRALTRVNADMTTSIWGTYNVNAGWANSAGFSSINLDAFSWGMQGSNLTFSPTGLFMAGTGCAIVTSTCADIPRIRHFPFSGSAYTVIGGASRTFTSDITTPGNIQNSTLPAEGGSYASLSSGLLMTHPFMQYDTSVNPPRLYYSEGTRLRYITNPLTSDSNSTLVTLFTTSTGVGNFIFNPPGGTYPAGSMIFFISRIGSIERLMCRANPEIAGAPSWCSAAGSNMGPNGFSTDVALAGNIGNVMTWKDSNTLLVRGANTVLQFDAR